MQKIIYNYFPNLTKKSSENLIRLIENNELEKILLSKYPKNHNLKKDTDIFNLAMEIKRNFLKKSPPLHKVFYDNKIIFNEQALGLHHYRYFVHGKNIVRKNEISISSQFKNVPYEFLEHIIIHELAHLKEKEHNKSFYNLCYNMQEKYLEISQDIRLYLILKEIKNINLWKEK